MFNKIRNTVQRGTNKLLSIAKEKKGIALTVELVLLISIALILITVLFFPVISVWFEDVIDSFSSLTDTINGFTALD